MQPAQRKHARAGEPSLPALPDGPLERIFALVIEREDSLRVMRLLHAALEETSADASPDLVDICGLAASASLLRALQTAPAGAPAAAPALGELLQRAAGGWMLQSGRMADPPGPYWDENTALPGVASRDYGRGAPMDGRGACTGVAALHRQLLRGCVDLRAVDKRLYRAWLAGSTGQMCKELIATLTAVGRQVRAKEPPPREMSEELRQRAYNTQYGPDHADRGANDLADAARDAEIERLQAAVESAQQDPDPRRAQTQMRRQDRLEALLRESRKANWHKNLNPGKRLPALLPAYEAKPDAANRRSDSYVGLFALVQLAAAAAVDLALLNRARADMRMFVAQLTDEQKATPLNTPSDIEALRDHSYAPVAYANPDRTLTLYFELTFARGTVYRASVEAGHGREDYVPVMTWKNADVKIDVREGLTAEQILQHLESESVVTTWKMEQYTVHNQHDQNAHETPNIALCPTVEYRPDGTDAVMEQAGAGAAALPENATEWVVGAEYHYGPVGISAEKNMTTQKEPGIAAPVVLAATGEKTSLSLMHYLPSSFAPALSLEDLLGGMQE
jgi:hypothetical protein